MGHHLCIYFIASTLVNPGTTGLEDRLRFQLQPHNFRIATGTASSDLASWNGGCQKQEGAVGESVMIRDLYFEAFVKLEEFLFGFFPP